VPIIRLVDAGMAPKIAEYVCFALARITRGLDRFAPYPRGVLEAPGDHGDAAPVRPDAEKARRTADRRRARAT
jgi:hypothetical protein